MLLKVPQSTAESWPVLTREAIGRLITKELVEVEILKMVPVGPVETLATTLHERLKEVEVPMRTCWPPVTVRKELEEVREAKVLVPVPPLITFKTPLTSEEPKAMLPLKRAPAVVDLTGRAWVRELRVVEPVTVRVPVMEEVAKKDRPLTVKAVAEALAKEEVALTVSEVKEGLGETETVEVPVTRILDP